MTIKIKNSKGRFEQNVKDGIPVAIDNLDIITNDELRECLRDRLGKSGSIFIRRTPKEDNRIQTDDDCYKGNIEHMGQNKAYLLFPWKQKKEITLCVYNILEMGYMNDMWMIVMHEFAHSCGWNHGDGKGVPGNYGFTRRRS